MKRFAGLFASAVLTLALTGCAAESSNADNSGGDRPDPPETTSSQTTGSSESKQAVTVTFHRSGGLDPVNETFVFSADRPAPFGHSEAEVDDVLEAASDPALINADLVPMPKNQCCDRQSYRVTIVWDDGSSRTYDTIDGVEQPAVFEDFLSRVA